MGRQNLSLKSCQSLLLIYIGRRFKSFHKSNTGSVGQRASKLLAVKVGCLKKKSANRPLPRSNHSAQIRLRPGSNHHQTLTASNFKALWPTDLILTRLKNLNLLKNYTKNQMGSCAFRINFALSKWPHLHNRVYLITVWYSFGITVNIYSNIAMDVDSFY